MLIFGVFGDGGTSRCLARFGLSFGCLPRSRPLAFATFIPSLVRILISWIELSHHRSHVEQQSPHQIGGSWIEPPRLSLTFRLVSSSKTSRASGSERASRSSC